MRHVNLLELGGPIPPRRRASIRRRCWNCWASATRCRSCAKRPTAIRAILNGVPADLAMTPEAPGKWSIAMVAQHLADSELVWGWRVRLILAHDRPAIAGYDQDAWAARLRYAEAPLEPALADFEGGAGRTNLRLLARAPESDRARTGLHAERGEESVAHMIRMSAGHDILHIRQIERILATVRSA